MTLRAGFEPARGAPIGFRVQRLNHSAIAASRSVLLQNILEKAKHLATLVTNYKRTSRLKARILDFTFKYILF